MNKYQKGLIKAQIDSYKNSVEIAKRELVIANKSTKYYIALINDFKKRIKELEE